MSSSSLLKRLWSCLVYEETDEYITAAAAFDGRLTALKHLFWGSFVRSIFPHRIYEMDFDYKSVDDEEIRYATRRIWKWRSREFAIGEWEWCSDE